MALELLSLFCTFENSTKFNETSFDYRSIMIPFRTAKRAIILFSRPRLDLSLKLTTVGTLSTIYISSCSLLHNKLLLNESNSMPNSIVLAIGNLHRCLVLGLYSGNIFPLTGEESPLPGEEAISQEKKVIYQKPYNASNCLMQNIG